MIWLMLAIAFFLAGLFVVEDAALRLLCYIAGVVSMIMLEVRR